MVAELVNELLKRVTSLEEMVAEMAKWTHFPIPGMVFVGKKMCILFFSNFPNYLRNDKY